MKWEGGSVVASGRPRVCVRVSEWLTDWLSLIILCCSILPGTTACWHRQRARPAAYNSPLLLDLALDVMSKSAPPTQPYPPQRLPGLAPPQQATPSPLRAQMQNIYTTSETTANNIFILISVSQHIDEVIFLPCQIPYMNMACSAIWD